MKRPYSLKKRKPQNVWYYRLADQITYHSTGETVKAKAMDFIDKLRYGSPTQVVRKKTLKEYCKDFFVWGICPWIQRTHERGLSFSKGVAQLRRGHLINHIFPNIGSKALDAIRISDIDMLFSALVLSNQTKNHILSTLSIVFSQAVREGEIMISPVASYEPFIVVAKEREIFSNEEYAKLFPEDMETMINIWKSSQYAALFSFLYSSGCRLGEALALSWEDIEKVENKTIRLYKGLKNDRTIGDTKTKDVKMVPFMGNTAILFHELKRATLIATPNQLVFLNSTGRPLCRGTVSKHFKKVVADQGIEIGNRNIDDHSFRHNFTTKSDQAVGVENTCMMTGHRSARMNERYNHPDESKNRSRVAELVPILEECFRTKNGGQNGLKRT